MEHYFIKKKVKRETLSQQLNVGFVKLKKKISIISMHYVDPIQIEPRTFCFVIVYI